jgi:hypothetical protein
MFPLFRAESFREFLSCIQRHFSRYAHGKQSQDALEILDQYTHEGLPDREARCLRAGFCRLYGGIGVNNATLRRVMNLSKSSVNAMFQKAGFVSFSAGYSLFKGHLARALPSLTERSLRDWSFRVERGRHQVSTAQQQLKNTEPMAIEPSPARKYQIVGWQPIPVFVVLTMTPPQVKENG